MSASAESIRFVVPRSASGSRLDRFVVSACAELPEAPSRAEVQRWIESGAVFLRGAAGKAKDALREGDEVVVTPRAPRTSDAVADPSVQFTLLHIDDDLLVLDKPPGLVVHPAAGHETGTLVNGLLARGWFRVDDVADPDDAEGHLRPGIVHRLDKGTSGIMVVARTAKSREALKAQFQIHSIDREYEAICIGAPLNQTIATLHGRHPVERMKFTTKVRDGKRAETHVTPLATETGKWGTYSHVVCRLETGRTHQIRVHLAEVARTPIFGDPVYGGIPNDPHAKRLANQLGRQALHARLLGFVHPKTGERLVFTSAPPADFQAVREALLPASVTAGAPSA